MLSKFLNSQEGKVLNKFLAMMLVMTLTFANFVFVGLFFGKSFVSYAKDEENEIKLEVQQKFITNKVYEVEDEFKRFVQLEVSSKLENAEGKATLAIPSTVIENLEPEDIKVTSYKTKFEFENGIINFNAREANSFIVTYVYNEEFLVNEETAVIEFNDEPVLNSEEVKMEVEIEENKNILAESEKIEETKQVQFGDIVLVSESLSNLYKGNMYLNKNTEYQKTLKIELTDIENKLVNEKIVINDNDSVMKKVVVDEEENFEDTENSAVYKSTVFNKTELLKLFGHDENAYVVISSKADDIENKTIILFGEYDEEEYADFKVIDITKLEEEKEITINYKENTSVVTVETSIPVKEGILNIKHNKEIVLEENEIVEDIAKLNSNTSLESANYTFKVENENEIKEPKTSALLSMEYLNANQTELSSLIDNEVNFTIDLLSNGPEHKLFDNPVIKINLPSEVKPLSIDGYSLALDDGLTIKNISIVDNSILVELNGKQEDYNSEDVKQSISIGAVLSVERTTPSGMKEISATVKNGEEDEINLESTQVNVFSPVDLIALTNLTVNGNKETSFDNESMIKVDTFANETTANVEFSLVNNHGVDLKDLVLKGTISDKNSTFKTYLKDEIKLNGLSYEIKYFVNGEETEDFTLADSFEITINEMKQGETFDISYTLNVPENLPYNESVFTTLNANYKYEEKINEKVLNMQITTGKGPSAKVEIIPNVEEEILNGGQVVTYNIKVTNDGDEDIPEAVLSFEAIENGNLVESEENIKDWKITDLKVGEDVATEVIVKLDDVKDKETFVAKATLIAGEKTIAIVDIENKIVPAKFKVTMENFYNSIENKENEQEYKIFVKNISNNNIKDVKLSVIIPEYTSLVDSYIIDNEKTKYIVEDGKMIYSIKELEVNKEYEILMTLEIDSQFPEEFNNELKFETYATVSADNYNKYQSNIVTNKFYKSDLSIQMTSDNNVNIKEFDSVKYNIKVTNNGKKKAVVDVEDTIPEEVSVNKVTYFINENSENTKYINDANLEVIYPVNIGETLNINIEGIVKKVDEQKTINNIAKLNLGNGEYLESEVITNIVEKENLQSNINQEENINEDNTGKKEKGKYNILGVVWLDENKDGKKDSNEKAIENVEINLINSKGEYIKNNKGEILTLKTSKDGAYSFDSLANGEYKVLFKYDTSKYQPTVYNAEGISSSVNSDAKSQTVTINGEKQTVALTDTIKIDNTSVVNIDLGLKENNTFDLSLKKEIKKVTVKNSSGTTDYDFTNTTFSKVEIPGKYFKGSTLVIEYDITVTNEGDIASYVTDILDYMPKELTFNSEMNTNWYIDSEGNLHNIALSMEEIEPGKSVTEKLILTKTLTTDEAITITNKAEIGSETNTEGLQETDSTPANKAEKEDDFGKAELIVSIKTGGALVYIGITLISLFIISAGIYLINKKVLKGNI